MGSSQGELEAVAIRNLNDRFRQEGLSRGTMLVTVGTQALGQALVHQAIQAVRSFDDFNEDNDPWGHHDFGAVTVGGEKVFWKIDAYDLTLTFGSPNPADEAVTHLVLTIMLASEY